MPAFPGSFHLCDTPLDTRYPVSARMTRLLSTPGVPTAPFSKTQPPYGSTGMNLARAGYAVRVKVTETSANFFSLLGSEPLVGRGFVKGEDAPGNNGVVILSYGLWQQAFGGDPRTLGSTVSLNGVPLTVIGIARPGFDYPTKSAAWAPTVFEFARLPKTAAAYFSEYIGRLRPGTSVPRATSMLNAQLEQMYPGLLKRLGYHPKLVPLQEGLAGSVRTASFVLLGAAGFVLLIACANVAILLLTRVTDRRRELLIRAALGASRARLVQQLMTESVLLSTIAALAGLAVAYWAARLASLVQPSQLSTQEYTALDWRVLAFAILLAALTGVIFGVFPAWIASRLQPDENLTRTQTRAGRQATGRMRQFLVGMEAALTIVLMAGSVIMGRSFLGLLGTDLGLHPHNVVTMSVSLAGTRRDTENGRIQYYREALERLRTIPGVEAAGAVDCLPLATNSYAAFAFELSSGKQIGAMPLAATSDYFRAIGTSMMYGQEFPARKREGTGPVAVVNEEFAKAAGEGPALIGRQLESPVASGLTIIGVARTVRFWGPSGEGFPQVFIPVEQFPRSFMTFVARVRGRAEDYLPLCRDALRSVDREVPVFGVSTLDEHLARLLARSRFYTIVVLFFGGFALLLSAIGVYGVASYSVSQHTHEIGVRLAVGGSREGVRGLLLRQHLLPVAIGMVIGVTGAMGLGKFAAHLMTTAKEIDPIACGAVAVVLAAIAAVSVWWATRRITDLNPIDVLRSE